MADVSENSIVLLRSGVNDPHAQGLPEFCDFLDVSGISLFRRGNEARTPDEEFSPGVLHASFFGACDGVGPNKVDQVRFLCCLANGDFGTSHVGEKTIIGDDITDGPKKFGEVGNWCAKDGKIGSIKGFHEIVADCFAPSCLQTGIPAFLTSCPNGNLTG